MITKAMFKLIAAAMLLSTVSFPRSSRGQGTAFSYEGRLNDNGNPANGFYDFEFRVFDTAPTNTGTSLGSPNPNSTNAVPVNNGVFSVILDFGISPFASGTPRWLDVAVRSNATGSFSTLNPRHRLTATPYAITASNLTGVVSSAGLAGIYSGAVAFSNPLNSFTGNGAGLTNVNAATLDGFTACDLPCYWKLEGNGGTTAGVNFVGTTDNQALVLKVNNITALEVRPAPTIPNIVGAVASTMPAVLGPNVSGVVIAGGNAPSGPFSGNQPQDFMAAYDNDCTIGGGFANKAGTDNPDPTDGAFATVGGGVQNVAAAFAATIGGGASNLCSGVRSVVAGGNFNQALGHCSFIGGGSNNFIEGSAPVSVVVGGWRNRIEVNAIGAAIAGGEQNVIGIGAGDAAIGGGSYNLAAGAASVIGGGSSNTASFDYATVAGGISNNAAGYAATAGGGEANSSGGAWSVVAGGYTNQVTGDYSIVGGGDANACCGQFATIGGGAINLCMGDYGTIPGGYSNYVSGRYSFAAGQQALAINDGAFVWADSQNAPFYSTANDEFSIRAQGGVRLNTDTVLVFGDTGASRLSWDQGGAIELGDSASSGTTPFIDFHYGIGGSPLTDYNVRLVNDGDEQFSIIGAGLANPLARFTAGGLEVNGTMSCTSDRNRKENFQPVDAGEVLAKVAALPMSKWNYKEDVKTTHLGPMAQDFYAAFGVGPDDKHIATVDAEGVALAAIQGLNQKLQETRHELDCRDIETAELKRRIEALEKTILNQKSN